MRSPTHPMRPPQPYTQRRARAPRESHDTPGLMIVVIIIVIIIVIITITNVFIVIDIIIVIIVTINIISISISIIYYCLICLIIRSRPLGHCSSTRSRPHRGAAGAVRCRHVGLSRALGANNNNNSVIMMIIKQSMNIYIYTTYIYIYMYIHTHIIIYIYISALATSSLAFCCRYAFPSSQRRGICLASNGEVERDDSAYLRNSLSTSQQ